MGKIETLRIKIDKGSALINQALEFEEILINKLKENQIRETVFSDNVLIISIKDIIPVLIMVRTVNGNLIGRPRIGIDVVFQQAGKSPVKFFINDEFNWLKHPFHNSKPMSINEAFGITAEKIVARLKRQCLSGVKLVQKLPS